MFKQTPHPVHPMLTKENANHAMLVSAPQISTAEILQNVQVFPPDSAQLSTRGYGDYIFCEVNLSEFQICYYV